MGISVVVPNRDGSGVLERCLRALRRAGADEVMVVDDGSTDGSDELARDAGAKVIRSPGRGFAAAVNVGVRETAGELVLVLNSDAFVAPGTPARLAAALAADDRLAACAAALVGEDGRRQKSAGRLLTLREALLRALGVPGTPIAERGGLQEVEFVPLACVLVRREALDEVGGLDEGYRFYFEDYDLCWRLRERGGRIAIDWDAEAVHVGGGSSSAADAAAWLPQFQRSRIRYLRRRYPRGWVLFAALWAPNALGHALLWLGRAVATKDRGARRRALRWARAYAATTLP